MAFAAAGQVGRRSRVRLRGLERRRRELGLGVVVAAHALDQSDALDRMVEEVLLADRAIVSTARRTGRAEWDEHVQGVEPRRSR
jgi:hypothetical protein